MEASPPSLIFRRAAGSPPSPSTSRSKRSRRASGCSARASSATNATSSSGSVEVLLELPDGGRRTLALLAGDFFGEAALLEANEGDEA